jgi:hypothetical protein
MLATPSAPENRRMSLLDQTRRDLSLAREATYRRLGTLRDEVLSRTTPLVTTSSGPVARAWPAEALGKLRLIRREKTVIVATDGISDSWDTSLHPSPPGWTFGFEVAVEAPLAAFRDASDQAIAASWMAAFLWAATDWVVFERFDLKTTLANHHCLTMAVPPFGGLDHLVASNGSIGALVGLPYGGHALGAQAVLAPEPGRPDDPV